MRGGSESGQATIEFVSMIPIVGVVMFAMLVIGTSILAQMAADRAVHAAVVAEIEGADARAAAVNAVPAWSRSLVSVSSGGGRIEVRVAPSGLPATFSRLVAAESVLRSAPRGSR